MSDGERKKRYGVEKKGESEARRVRSGRLDLISIRWLMTHLSSLHPLKPVSRPLLPFALTFQPHYTSSHSKSQEIPLSSPRFPKCPIIKFWTHSLFRRTCDPFPFPCPVSYPCRVVTKLYHTHGAIDAADTFLASLLQFLG